MHHHAPRDVFAAAFLEMDADGDGHLTPAELRAAMHKLGEALTPGEAERLIERYDRNGSGAIEIQELIEALLAAQA